MRVLIVSNLFPPAAFGGYELECGRVAEHLALRHEVLVLTSSVHRRALPAEPDVRRELPFLAHDAAGAVRAPAAALAGAGAARRALAWRPDLVYAWNGASIPHAVLRVLADSKTPLAFRVCEHWFGGLFVRDQFMRELLPGRRGAARGLWAVGCRALDRLPSLRLVPDAPLRAALSWNSLALRRAVATPPFAEVVLEQVLHPAPPYGDAFESVPRAPAPDPEIAFLGRVTPYKGLEVAIEALALLRAEGHPAARLVVIGPEQRDYGERMRHLATARGVAEAISWRGQLDPERSAAALSRAHALIVPSLWEEPFGLVAIEGALARVPVVAADVGGITEGLRPEEHALLFARGDAAAAAGALRRVLEDRSGTDARVARARRRAEEFRIGPYLRAQEQFVLDAAQALAE
ncbi:MAG TPA: glycosyltransferase family 4 protein [Solirubrobacteraceae bacterium]|nr:glycosyltransferase family 4 protein [Solirubrobacteraceae bacterium]